MFTLVTDRSRYFRVKRGQNACEIERALNIPVPPSVFAGEILPVSEAVFSVYKAVVGDTYRTVALRFGVEEGELKKANGFRPVYPTCKIFVPKV